MLNTSFFETPGTGRFDSSPYDMAQVKMAIELLTKQGDSSFERVASEKLIKLREKFKVDISQYSKRNFSAFNKKKWR